MKRNISNILLILASCSFTYIFAEIIYSYFFINYYFDSIETIWFHEAVENKPIHVFDPVLGYKIAPYNSRFGAYTSDGRLQSIGTLKGNNLGFPDNRDFYPQKDNPDIIRIAVFGDSFTASQFTPESWVQIAEENINKYFADSIVLLNFSVDGGGISNWERIVKYILIKNKFELDGVIFAVLGDNLERKFVWKDDALSVTGEFKFAFNYVNSLEEDIDGLLREMLIPVFPSNYKILSSEEVNLLEKGLFEPEKREIKPYLFYKAFEFFKGISFSKCFSKDKNSKTFHYTFSDNEDRLVLTERIASYTKELNIPVLTLSFYSDHNSNKEFAKYINSSFIDDSVFMTKSELLNNRIFIEGDGHWNSKGVELFAECMSPELIVWLRTEIQNLK